MLRQLLLQDDRQLLRLLSLARQGLTRGDAALASTYLKTFCDQLDHRLALEEQKVVRDFLQERPEQRLLEEQTQLRGFLTQLSQELKLPLGLALEANLGRLEDWLRAHFTRKQVELYAYLDELATLRRLVLDSLEHPDGP